MAIIEPWDADRQQQWDAWVNSRPPVVAEMARRFFPNRLYRMKSTGQRVTIYSFNENGTMSVNVTGDFNRVLFSRTVFGVPPEDLEECDLPGPDEDVGDTSQEAGYTEADVRNILIPKLREAHSCDNPDCGICRLKKGGQQ